MNVAVAKAEPAKPAGQSLINVMAAKYNMEPKAYAEAVKKTAMPSNATNEEFAAFMMVAREYNLNPLLKEIHAFPRKGGGIVPVVSIDGWINIVNQQRKLNGFEFEMHYNEKAELVACTCRMHRTDRAHPVVVTEYLSECKRNTEPWKMEHRMLRHKALIQASRYCFGLSGIMDQDEAEKIAEMRDITPISPERPKLQDFINPKTGEIVEQKLQPQEPESDESEEEETPEFSHKEARDLGIEARNAGRALASIPTDLPEEFCDAWQDGWRARDDEINAEKKPAKKIAHPFVASASHFSTEGPT